MLTSPMAQSDSANDQDNQFFEVIPGDPKSGYLLICDHATNIVPPCLDAEPCLGLPGREFERHIAFDIGVRDLTIELAAKLGAPAVLSRFSRLVIDPNRGPDDPTLVMRIADGAVVPGNANISQAEIDDRRARFHSPYHRAIGQAIDQAMDGGVPPALFSIHSFTPIFKGHERPWHATVLWDDDPRLPLPLLRALEAEDDLVVGENVPYSGALKGDTLFTHGKSRGLANALIEVRQDLISTQAASHDWANRLAGILAKIVQDNEINATRAKG